MTKYKMSLEKVVFCEKYTGDENVAGPNPKLSCHTARRCEMKEIYHETCYDAFSTNVTGGIVNCPTDALFKQKVAKKDAEIISLMCANR